MYITVSIGWLSYTESPLCSCYASYVQNKTVKVVYQPRYHNSVLYERSKTLILPANIEFRPCIKLFFPSLHLLVLGTPQNRVNFCIWLVY